MAFPSSPVDSQTAVVNGITYYYQASTNAWRRFTGGSNLQLNTLTVSNQITLTNVAVGSSIGISTTEAYDIDDISNYTDGKTGTFRMTYNGSTVSVATPWNLDVYVNGAKQPAFKYNGDTVWLSSTLAANKGYCLDYTGNLKFADTVPARSSVTVTTKVGSNSQSTKRYPFNPLDIVLGI